MPKSGCGGGNDADATHTSDNTTGAVYSIMEGFMSGLKTRMTKEDADETNRKSAKRSRSMMIAMNFHSSAILLS